MAALRIAAVAALLAIVVAGCTPPAPVETSSSPAARGTVIVLQGSAFQSARTRETAVRVAGDVTSRPAHAIADEPPFERVTRPLERGVGTATLDASCRKRGRSVATAIAEHADVVVRIRLDARTTARPATDADRTDLGTGSSFDDVLSAVAGRRADTVYETTLDGTVERTTFAGAVASERRPVRWIDRRLGTAEHAPVIDVDEALRHAFAGFASADPARWEPIARGLVAGCPLLAIAVADGAIDDPAAQRKIRGAARASVQSAGRKRDDAHDAAEAPAEPTADAAPPAPEPPGYSCAALCTLHMVELCNNDRTLWSQHGSRWENTRCGVRRSEPFLEDCYRMQWLSGTYERACVRPCESDGDGRLRLLGMLRRSGCLRAGG
jgi:hypothetical protein